MSITLFVLHVAIVVLGIGVWISGYMLVRNLKKTVGLWKEAYNKMAEAFSLMEEANKRNLETIEFMQKNSLGLFADKPKEKNHSA